MNRIININYLVTKLIVAVVLLFSIMFYAAPVIADEPTAPSATATAVCEGIGLAGGDCNSGGGAGSKVSNVIENIINIFSWIVGAVAVIVLIFGGFKYVTSGGDQNKVKTAKDTILYALIGLVIVALSQVIVNFVLNAANKSTQPASQKQQSQTQ